ncbi:MULTISPECIES: CBS domain-containing protein [Trichocoleus]|uniref:CBS domain-containing protein n=1 Tax=Trichocoleus desertorum GB2-A4 TaxID=2933944 RepID=A0ABV0JC20_9CYAN|nr:CBS domain-containing protein [Trichocoleus sp. FACHB-46]MBD1861515.1 CBS domain-containing protein [Trichocoleus sp. FACHB-46]
MDLILCHTTADFDTLGAAVGLTRLQPGARIVLSGGSHPAVHDFLALHRDEYPLIERRSVSPQQIRSLAVVDAQRRDRIGKTAEWLDLPDIEITVYDHHLNTESDIPATSFQVEPVGATSTLIAEQLQAQAVQLTPAEATVMALGVHVDTGSLTYDHATARDALALAWLMEQGANLKMIAEYIDPGLSPQLQELFAIALDGLQTEELQGHRVAWVLLQPGAYIPGLSSLASRITELTESDALLLAAHYPVRAVDPGDREETDLDDTRLSVIGRSQIEGTDLNELFKPLGGGGHSKAAALTLRGANPESVLQQLRAGLQQQIPQSPTARELMSSPVRTIRPETTINEAQRILLRYGHSGLSVVDAQGQLVGIISRRDLDIALHHGFGHAPVKGYMTTNLKMITPETLLPDIESLMVTYDIGRLPVLEENQLVGIVTRTDVLRQLHQMQRPTSVVVPGDKGIPLRAPLQEQLKARLVPQLWSVLAVAAQQAEARGWHLYLVGGAVRDLLLADPEAALLLNDIDLVVDGYHRALQEGAGVELARALQQQYPQARLDIHGQFQTAALLWHKDPELDSLWVDIATARTEFYPYPAANPEVEASSIRQDLYRRDFTINALAIRLTAPRSGELLDFFGGLLDLRSRQIRVLHANSFIEDPTRIYRAVRFAVRLGFEIDPQTEGYIRHAIESGVYDRVQDENSRAPALQTRLKSELKYVLAAPYWQSALQLLSHLGALRCIHPTLTLTPALWHQIRLMSRWLRRFDSSNTLVHWQMLLEVLIADLAPEYRGKIAANLQLPVNSIEALQQLATTQADLASHLTKPQKPSQVVQLLSQYDRSTLILIAARSPRALRQLIWRYLICWAQVKPLLDGNDLKALGYKPSRQFKQILSDLTAATLDGVIGDRDSAIAFLAQHYPLD